MGWNRYQSAFTQILLNTKKVSGSDCVLWTGAVNSSGYGRCGNTYWAKYYKVNMAHQLAFVVAYGAYERYFQLNHTCDNPLCVNPDHLYLGTQQDNIKDMEDRGRRVILKGVAHSGSKLSEVQVLEIRSLCLTMKNKDVALLYKVTPECISSIKNRSSWKWL